MPTSLNSTSKQSKIRRVFKMPPAHRPTKPPSKAKKRNLVLDAYIRQYKKELRENAAKLQWHINSGYCRRDESEKTALLRDFLESDSPFQSVNNPEARIHFYKYWAVYGHRFASGQDAYLVTLTPIRYVLPLKTAGSFDIRKLQAWVRNELRGFDYIGIVEIAYYTNIAKGLLQPPAIAFHVHVIVRNPNRLELRDVVDRINAKHDSLVPGCPAADMRLITRGDHHTVLKYMVKEPCGIYRAYPMRAEVMDPETGELVKQHTGRYWQNSKPATPGVQLRARSVIANWHMDKIVFGGGAGRDVVETIRKQSLRSLPHKLRSGRQFEHSGYFEAAEED